MAPVPLVDPDADLGLAVVDANDVASLGFELLERVAQVQALTFARKERVHDGHGNFDADLLGAAFFALLDVDANEIAFPADVHRLVVSFDGNELRIARCAQLSPDLAKVLDVEIMVHLMQVDFPIF